MPSLQQVILFLVYAAIAVYGLHYHTATPLIHAASFLSLIYLIKQKYLNTKPLNRISQLWLACLIIWPSVYIIAYFIEPGYVSKKIAVNLIQSTLLVAPIFLALRSFKITKKPIIFASLLSLLGSIISSIFNYFTNHAAEPIYLSTGSINISIVFGNIIAMQIAICLVFILNTKKTKPALQVILYTITLLGVLSLGLTGSRGAMAAIILPLSIFFVLLFIKLKRKVIFSAATTLGVCITTPFLIASPVFQKSLLKFTDISLLGIFGERLYIWRAALEKIANHPWAGYGVGKDKQAIAEYAYKNNLAEQHATYGHIHNDILQSIFSFGLPIGILLCFLLYSPALTAIHTLYKKHKEYIALTPVFICLSFFVSGLTDSAALQAPSMKFYCLTISLFLALHYQKKCHKH
ncbi:MAG: O-antigen ligase family protein [Cellvibrionales bacterium]|nr:O-antigen ligase family protein [Cellvibrionales bacterium]